MERLISWSITQFSWQHEFGACQGKTQNLFCISSFISSLFVFHSFTFFRDDAVVRPASGSGQHQPGAPAALPAPKRRSQRRPHLQNRRKVRRASRAWRRLTERMFQLRVWCLNHLLVSVLAERKGRELKSMRSKAGRGTETGKPSSRDSRDKLWNKTLNTQRQRLRSFYIFTFGFLRFRDFLK